MVRNRLAVWLMVCCLVLLPFLVTQKIPTARAAGTTYVVNTATDDPGGGACAVPASTDCSLRSAIQKANGTPNAAIVFTGLTAADPQYSNGRWTIALNSQLPQLTAAGTVISGTLNADPIPIPNIVLDGTRASGAAGLRVRTSAIRIIGLELRNFASGAVQLQGSLPNSTAGSILKSLSLYNNGSYGIEIGPGSTTTTLGGTGVGEQIVIGGTNGSALRLVNNSSGTTLSRSYIGFSLNAGTLSTSANSGDGIFIDGSKDNTIGGTVGSPSPRNVISNNAGNGVFISAASGFQAANNTIAGNYIGVGIDGVSDAGNGKSGVRIESGATGNTVSGSSQNRSVIGFNNEGGVRIDGDTTSGNRVLGSFIGVNSTGVVAAANDLGGVLLTNDTSGNTVGDVGQGNVIAGNNGYGVYIGAFGQNTTNTAANALKANVIGLNSSSAAALANTNAGVYLADGAKQTLVGAAGAGNTIAGNAGAGVVITGTNTLSTTLTGNTIGLRLDTKGRFSQKAPNGGDGVLIGGGARGSTIGGPNAAAGNTIAGNTTNGIRITGATTTVSTIQYATVGTVVSGTLKLDALGNGANGILVDAGTGVTIRNSTIYSNTLSGVKVTGNTQRVGILDTSFTGNGVGKTGDDAKAIALVGTTVGGGDTAKPNHDIDPPNTVRVDQARQITGRVPVSGASACTTCTVQFFGSNPATRDSQGRDQLAVTNYRITANGYFTATLPSVPRQLALTATDGQGNTSEFSTFLVTTTVAISRVGVKPPAPGPSETVQYTFRVTNTGSIDLADLAVTAKSSKNWTVDWQPKTLSLRANPNGIGESKLVTVTLTLPDGTDARVRFPTTDTTVVTVTSVLIPAATANASVTTDVASKFVLRVTPTALSGQGVTTDPDNPVIIPYIHSLSNSGNLTGTVTLTATTDLFNAAVPANWKTTIDRTTITLPPGGKPVTVTVRVQLPYSGANAGQVAKTTLKVTQTDPTPVKTTFYTDTTTITASRRATITPSNVGDGAAAQVRTFLHTVTNFSNTTATFKLTGASSLGSAVTFRSNTAGVTLNADNTFTLGTSSSNNVFNFYVDVGVNPRALRGDTDTITISLANADGTVVGGVQDTINIVQGSILPRAYLPLIAKR